MVGGPSSLRRGPWRSVSSAVAHPLLRNRIRSQRGAQASASGRLRSGSGWAAAGPGRSGVRRKNLVRESGDGGRRSPDEGGVGARTRPMTLAERRGGGAAGGGAGRGAGGSSRGEPSEGGWGRGPARNAGAPGGAGSGACDGAAAPRL